MPWRTQGAGMPNLAGAGRDTRVFCAVPSAEWYGAICSFRRSVLVVGEPRAAGPGGDAGGSSHYSDAVCPQCLVGAGEITGSTAITGHHGDTTAKRAVVVAARARKIRTAGAGDVEPSPPPLSQYKPGGREDAFSHPTMWPPIPGRRLSRLLLVRRGCGSWAYEVPYIMIPALGTGSLSPPSHEPWHAAGIKVSTTVVVADAVGGRSIGTGQHRERPGLAKGPLGNVWMRVWQRPRPETVRTTGAWV